MGDVDQRQGHERRVSEESRERETNRRLEHLETAQSAFRDQLSAVSHRIELLGSDQKHFATLIDAKFGVMEKTHLLTDQKVDALKSDIALLRTDILAMAGEAQKTPVGRLLDSKINSIEHHLESTDARCERLKERMDQYEGAVKFLYIAGPSGIGALIWVALRAFGKLP